MFCPFMSTASEKVDCNAQCALYTTTRENKVGACAFNIMVQDTHAVSYDTRVVSTIIGKNAY